jgi:hypothetical protein
MTEPKTSIGFYSGKKEVDFVMGNFGFELKWQNNTNISDFPKVDIKNRIILSKKTLKYENTENTQIIPLPLFLSML